MHGVASIGERSEASSHGLVGIIFVGLFRIFQKSDFIEIDIFMYQCGVWPHPYKMIQKSVGVLQNRVLLHGRLTDGGLVQNFFQA